MQRHFDRDLARLSKGVDRAGKHAQQADQTIKALEKSVTSLLDQLHEEFQEAIQCLKHLQRLPDHFKDLEEAIQRQFETSFTRQFESQVIDRQGKVIVHQSRIEALERYLTTRQRQLSEQLERVQERYSRLLSEVAENNTARRKAMDSHAYALLEEVYPDQVQARFSHISLPLYPYLGRSAALLNAFEALEQAVVEYLDDYRRAVEEAASLVHASLPVGRYVLDVYAVEIEDMETGRRRLELRVGDDAAELPAALYERLESTVRGLAGRREIPHLGEEDRQKLAAFLADRGVCAEEVARLRGEEIGHLGLAG